MGFSDFYDLLDFRFSLSREMIDGNGEDSFFSAVNENRSVAAVFDGCGGLGAKEYRNFQGKTGAYIAARLANGATKAWFDTLKDTATPAEAAQYKQAIDYAFSLANEYADKNTTIIKGSMHKPFPTTVATAVTTFYGRTADCTFLWAGDSRGYILDRNGLHQITTDDIANEDAMSNLLNDGVLTNVVTMTGNYTLHAKTVPIDRQMLIFCATDGCFGYLSTPMEFEYLLLETLFESDTPAQWKEKLYNAFGEVAGDDYTLSLLSIGYGDFGNLKKALAQRKTFMESSYIHPMENITIEEKFSFWQKYKPDYERI